MSGNLPAENHNEPCVGVSTYILADNALNKSSISSQVSRKK